MRVHRRLLAVVLFVLIRIHPDVVERELLLDAILEHLPLLQSQTIRLCNHGNHIHRLAQLLQYHDIDRLQRMSGRRNEVQTAVNPGILNVPLTLGGELFAQVGGVLVLDVLDDGVPAAIVVDEVAVAWSVDDVQTQAHAVLFDDVGDGVDFGSLTNLF